MTESLLSHMPSEVLIKIFQELDFYDVQCISLCCKRFYTITLLPEFQSKSVFKITTGVLDDNHPAAQVILVRHIEKLYLKSVTIGNADNLFRHIGTSLKCLRLKSVHLTPALQLICNYFPNLETLRISPPSFFMDDFNFLPIGTWPAIKNLMLLGNCLQTNEYLHTRLLNGQNLEQLTIEFTGNEERKVLEVLEQHSQSLRKLDLRLYRCGFLQVSRWTNTLRQMKLNELSMKGAFCAEIILSATQGHTNFKSLDVAGSVGIRDQLPGLEKLNLSYCAHITDNGMKELLRMSHLKMLKLNYCNLITSEGVRSFIGKTIHLSINELHFQDLNIDEELIILCANNLPNLRILNLSGCKKAVTDNTIQKIFYGQLQLRELKLDNCIHFSDGGLLGLSTGHSIQNLKFLQRLSLRGCVQLTDFTLDCSLKLPNLKFLDIAHWKKLSKYGILSLVANCNALEEISATICDRIGPDSIQTLFAGLGRLRILTINNCDKYLRDLELKSIKLTYFSDRNSVILRK